MARSLNALTPPHRSLTSNGPGRLMIVPSPETQMRLGNPLRVPTACAAMIRKAGGSSSTPAPADTSLNSDLAAAWATHGQRPLVVSAIEGGQKPAPAPERTKAPKPVARKAPQVARVPAPRPARAEVAQEAAREAPAPA